MFNDSKAFFADCCTHVDYTQFCYLHNFYSPSLSSRLCINQGEILTGHELGSGEFVRRVNSELRVCIWQAARGTIQRV